MMDKVLKEELPPHMAPSSLWQFFVMMVVAPLVGHLTTFLVYNRLEGPEEPTEVAALVYFLKRSSIIWFTLWFILMLMADSRLFTGTTPWNSSSTTTSNNMPTAAQVADRIQQNTFESAFQALGAGLTLAVWCAGSDIVDARISVAYTITFCLSRIPFTIGYFVSPPWRYMGNMQTYYPNFGIYVFGMLRWAGVADSVWLAVFCWFGIPVVCSSIVLVATFSNGPACLTLLGRNEKEE